MAAAMNNRMDLESIAGNANLNAPQAVKDAVAAVVSNWNPIVAMNEQLLKQRAMEASRELMEQLPCAETREVYEETKKWLAAEGQ
jgi:hypothetical protein